MSKKPIFKIKWSHGQTQFTHRKIKKGFKLPDLDIKVVSVKKVKKPTLSQRVRARL